MNRSSKHSKGKVIVTYMGAITMLGAAALSIDVALGFMSNMPAYLHVQSAQSVNAVAASSAAPVLAQK